MPTIEKEILYAEEEVTYNTDPTVAAANALIAFEVDYKENSQLYRRGIQSPIQDPMRVGIIGMRQPTLSFRTEVFGHSTDLAAGVKPAHHHLYQSIGYAGVWNAGTSSWDYTYAAPTTCKSTWFNIFKDGMWYAVGGARGSFDLDLTPGERAMMAWSYAGKYRAPYVDPGITPTPVDTTPAMVESITLDPYADTDTYAPYNRITKATLSLRGEVYRHPDVNGTDGDSEILVLGKGTPEDRGAQIVFEVTRPGDGADDDLWWIRWIARTISAAATIKLGSSTLGKKQQLTITLARLVVDAIEDIQIGSLFGHRVTCTVMASAAAVTDDGVLMSWKQH